MPSPFPGMDPYLEDPAIWPGLHLGLLDALINELAFQVRPRYVVRLAERAYSVAGDDPAWPLLARRLDEGVPPGTRPALTVVDRWLLVRACRSETPVTVVDVVAPHV